MNWVRENVKNGGEEALKLDTTIKRINELAYG